MFIPNGEYGYGPPASDDLGLTMTSDGARIWQLSEGRNAWHHVVSYWHMQASGLSIMIPVSDYEAREFNLGELRTHLRPDSVDELYMWAEYSEVGWPLPALTCSIHWKEQIRNEDVIYSVRNGINLGRDRKYDPLALPFAPVWPGFVLDILFWTFAWLALATGINALRAWRWHHRTICVHCGYSRRGLPPRSVCPECGRVNDLK